MLDIEPELDRKLRALYDHIETQDPPASLALITTPAFRSGREVLGRLVGVAGIAAIAAGIALFAVEWHVHRLSSSPTPITHPRPVPPSVVPQGWIAVSVNPWSDGAGENGDIYLLRAGALPRLIIGHAVDGIAQACPAFSPDGQRLAYGEARASGSVTTYRGVWPVSDRAVVVVGLSNQGDPSQQLMRVTLPTGAGEMACPKWSPDGRDVAFRVGAGLWVADTTSGRTTVFQVGSTPWGEQAFAWSRDGSRIAVAEPGQIRVIPIDGSTPAAFPITGDVPGSYSGSMGWTAGDGAIVYTGTDAPGDPVAIYRVDADGTHNTQIASGNDVAANPGGSLNSVVSPDGTRVAYIDGLHVLTIDTRGGHVVAVPVPPGFLLEGLLWSPDGRRLLLSSVDGVVSVAVAPGSAPIVYAGGQSSHPGNGLDLEWSFSEVTWQPVVGPTR